VGGEGGAGVGAIEAEEKFARGGVELDGDVAGVGDGVGVGRLVAGEAAGAGACGYLFLAGEVVDVEIDAARDQEREENFAEGVRGAGVGDQLAEFNGQRRSVVEGLGDELDDGVVAREAAAVGVVGEEESVHTAGINVVREFDLGAAEQGLAEAAELEEIEILLALEKVPVRDFAGVEHFVRVGLAEVLEVVAGGVGGEFVEPDGVIDGGEVVVEEDVVLLFEKGGSFFVGQ